MKTLEAIRIIAAENGGIIENKVALAHGISRQSLAKLLADGALQRTARGQYILAEEMQDELLALSKRSRYIVFSHETALFLHGISDRVPFVHAVTIPSDRVLSPSLQAECKVYYIKPERFELGKALLPTPAGNKVPAYDLERTICDVVRSRNKLGAETFLSALKAYAVSPKKNLNKLYDYAKEMRLAGTVRKYLEVLL